MDSSPDIHFRVSSCCPESGENSKCLSPSLTTLPKPVVQTLSQYLLTSANGDLRALSSFVRSAKAGIENRLCVVKPVLQEVLLDFFGTALKETPSNPHCGEREQRLFADIGSILHRSLPDPCSSLVELRHQWKIAQTSIMKLWVEWLKQVEKAQLAEAQITCSPHLELIAPFLLAKECMLQIKTGVVSTDLLTAWGRHCRSDEIIFLSGLLRRVYPTAWHIDLHHSKHASLVRKVSSNLLSLATRRQGSRLTQSITGKYAVEKIQGILEKTQRE